MKGTSCIRIDFDDDVMCTRAGTWTAHHGSSGTHGFPHNLPVNVPVSSSNSMFWHDTAELRGIASRSSHSFWDGPCIRAFCHARSLHNRVTNRFIPSPSNSACSVRNFIAFDVVPSGTAPEYVAEHVHNHLWFPAAEANADQHGSIRRRVHDVVARRGATRWCSSRRNSCTLSRSPADECHVQYNTRLILLHQLFSGMPKWPCRLLCDERAS